MTDPDQRPTGPPGPAPTGPAGPGPTGPAGPRPNPDGGALADIDACLVAALALATTSGLVGIEQACATEILRFRLRAARLAVRRLAAAYGIETPARQDHSGPRSASCLAAAGGPVQPPTPEGEARAPGCVTAAGTAGTGSDGRLAEARAGADVPVVASTRDAGSAGGAADRAPGVPGFAVGTALLRGSAL